MVLTRSARGSSGANKSGHLKTFRTTKRTLWCECTKCRPALICLLCSRTSCSSVQNPQLFGKNFCAAQCSLHPVSLRLSLWRLLPCFERAASMQMRQRRRRLSDRSRMLKMPEILARRSPRGTILQMKSYSNFKRLFGLIQGC